MKALHADLEHSPAISHEPGPLSRLTATVLRWQRRARERAELLQLDARSKRDLGLGDAEIWREISKARWQA
jgi:uncharacterized protein YjiS (DUF1127 family)